METFPEDLEVVLIGEEPQLDALLTESGYSGERISLIGSEGFVGMEEKPTEALRRKPNSSIAASSGCHRKKR